MDAGLVHLLSYLMRYSPWSWLRIGTGGGHLTLDYIYQVVYICLSLWNVEIYHLCTLKYTLLINGRDSENVQLYIYKHGRSAEFTKAGNITRQPK